MAELRSSLRLWMLLSPLALRFAVVLTPFAATTYTTDAMDYPANLKDSVHASTPAMDADSAGAGRRVCVLGME